MRIPFRFRPRPGHSAVVLAEAQALLESGHDLDTVLAIYEHDSAWLAPLLECSENLQSAIDAEPPSYYFEASLKSRFLEAARERKYRPIEPQGVAGRARTAIASGIVLAGTAAAGIVTFGFVTADNAVPGDWNYVLKTTQERVDYALARGDSRVDIQLHQTHARVYEIQVLTDRGTISPEQIKKFESEVSQLRTQIEKQTASVDAVQKTQLKALQDLSTVVLNAATEKNDRVKPAADSARSAVAGAVAASVGTVAVVTEPSPTPSTTPLAGIEPGGTTVAISVPSASPTSSVEPSATGTPVPPAATQTPPPVATPASTASPAATTVPASATPAPATTTVTP